MENTFALLIKKHESSLKRQSALAGFVGYVKLVLCLLIIYITYLLFSDHRTQLYILDGVIFIILVTVWIYHIKLFQRIEYLKSLILINQKHIGRLDGSWTNFNDLGEEFIDNDHPYSNDLDIVGRKSLFQWLNITNTWLGRHAFARDLLQVSYTNEELKLRQNAVQEISKQIEFMNDMSYYFSKIGKHADTPKLVRELSNNERMFQHQALGKVLAVGPFVTLILIIAVHLLGLQSANLLTAVIAFTQAAVWLFFTPKTSKYIANMRSLPYKLSAYETVIRQFMDRSFESETLEKMKAELSKDAQQGFHSLNRITEMINLRSNGVLYFVLNLFLLWDLQCAYRFDAWKRKYAHLSERWFKALGEFESLMCFALMPNICSQTCLPTALNSSKTIQATALGHPLLQNATRVPNNLSLQNSIYIISGSNMSGKTTFLRTVGINLVLAQAGGFVCAQYMVFSPANIVTSMRILDDLNEGVSTFYAELKRIKMILEEVQRDRTTLFLIDEIFRGTNSVDRLSGAITVLTQLNKYGAYGLITTHDLELCQLAEQYARIKNFNFTEQYKDRKINFDYIMRAGKSNTTNAKYLMEMVGIL